MIFGQNRDELRQMYRDAWRKHVDGKVLTPLETQIARVVEDHPEYQQMVSSAPLDAEFTPDDGAINPFLHMGLHLAIRDQVSTDRPAGIASLYQQRLRAAGDPHVVEHAMLDILGECLWDAQRNGTAPDEARYLERLRAGH